MYTLNFETIKQMMQAYQQTGSLYAEVPSGVGRLREPCRIEVTVVSGQISSCAIVGSSGRYLTGKEAVRELTRLGRLNWTFTPREEQEVVESSPVSSASIKAVKEGNFLPRRTLYLEPVQMRNWPRLHRAVFALADGTKSAVKMAEVLSVPPDVVERALKELQSIGVIAFGRQDGKERP
jgi:hypothetical protein